MALMMVLVVILLLLLALVMDPPHMIFHVVHARENAAALFSLGAPPLALDAWVVLGFVPRAVLLAREAACQGLVGRLRTRSRGGFALRATIHTAEKVFAVSVVVFPQVTSAGKGCARRAARVSTAPGLGLSSSARERSTAQGRWEKRRGLSHGNSIGVQ